ncbi:hypothetical protein OG205_44905 [Lentzea sp. NBC_00516]|uniref:hypothetical protein n=1 Tax=Lentzea sp. NBC_00516 TaxID=2903582 RepID=UPI002E81677A|nr:hypothetical protein [Lentzea sp. NBC_00516]WUD25082.1 hypothetical protein OG205_44905 [Lentzea sp. NBC_00516]
MTSMLPPTRDLPPGRQARIRAEVERAVTGRKSRRLAVPILAAAAVIAVVTAGVVVLRPVPSLPQPAVHVTTSPPPKTPDFGVPPETVKAIEKGCAGIAGTGEAKLYQLLDGEVRWALLYSDNSALDCTMGVGGMEYNSGFSGTEVNWLPGHFSIDHSGASSGGDLNLKPVYAGVPGNRTVIGRIDDRVARMTYTIEGKTVEATIANGTFAVRIYYPSNWVIPDRQEQGIMRAYDAAGTLIATDSDMWNKCFVNPEGKIVHGDRRMDPLKCEPALPWKPR